MTLKGKVCGLVPSKLSCSLLYGVCITIKSDLGGTKWSTFMIILLKSSYHLNAGLYVRHRHMYKYGESYNHEKSVSKPVRSKHKCLVLLPVFMLHCTGLYAQCKDAYKHYKHKHKGKSRNRSISTNFHELHGESVRSYPILYDRLLTISKII